MEPINSSNTFTNPLILNRSSTTYEKQQIMGIFKVMKLGKRHFSNKERLLVVNETSFAYYVLPEAKKVSQTFISTLDKIYNSKKISSSNTKSEDEDKDLNLLNKEFNENIKSFVKKEEILYDQCETIYEIDKKDNPKEWKYCIEIRQKLFESSKTKEPNIYAKISKTEGEKLLSDSKNKQWILNLYEANYLERYKKLLEEIKKKKLSSNTKEITSSKAPPQEAPKIPKIIKKEEDPQKKEEKIKIKDESTNENEPEVIQMMYYNEICYQYLLKQFYTASTNFQSNNNPQTRMKYEFALIQLNTKFKEICQTLAKRIVSDLYAKPFSQSNPSSYYLFPIVFPYPTKLKKPEQAVFLYYIGGINFTLTWHQTLFKMRNEQKLDLEEVQLNGAWNHLSVDFKNKDFFQDMMSRISRLTSSKVDLPRHPLSCLIDYCGFRILCEADIYIDDGGSAVFKRSDNINSHIQNNDPNYNFYKELTNILTNEKLNNNLNNVKSSQMNSPNIKGEDMQLTAESLIPVFYQNRDTRQLYSKQLYNFQHVIKYHSKQFQEVDNFIFKNSEIENIIKESKPTHDHVSHLNVTSFEGNGETSTIYFNKDNTLNISLNNDANNMDPKISKEKLNEFFDLCGNKNINLHLKDFKETVKYIMDLKILIEIKDKFTDQSLSKQSTNFDNNYTNSKFLPMPKRSIYFRPEFIIKYLSENGLFKTIEKENDTSELIIKTLKKYLYLDENNQPLYKNIFDTYKYFKENHINYFINCLDTMHFNPYDSETLTETFHSYGVNMFYLGLVSELTSVPHVRELCMIEMISRICKKLLFDIMSLKIIRRANEDYYSGGNDHGKNIVEYDVTSNTADLYLQYVPVTFFTKYWKDYLRKCHVLGNDSFKCAYYEENNKGTTTYAKGLYRRFWHRCTSYSDKDIKPIFQVKEEKAGKTNKDNTETNMLTDIKKEITQFFNTLFDFETNTKTCKILNFEYNNKLLWEMIFERVKTHYNIENREVFTYCDPLYISLPALFSSIQYHSGISINFTIINNTKFSNKDLISKEFTEDMIEIKPISKMYSNRNFVVNRQKFDTMRNDYSLDCDKILYKKVLLRFFVEKFQKNISTYTWGYLHYMNTLRRMDGSSSDSLVDWIAKNDNELKEKIKTDLDYYDYFKSQFISRSTKFESFNYLFLQIIESYSNIIRDESNYVQNEKGNVSKNIAVNIIPSDFNSAIDYISEFWFSKHPFLSILYILVGRLNLKTTKHFDEKTESYFKLALSICKDSLGNNNIFVANLCEEIGFCYIKSKNFYDGIRHYIMAYNVFKDYKEEFFECFMKILKKITKYFIILGYYKDALEYGTELIQNYLQNIKKAQLIDNFNADVIIYNLILISKSLGEFDKGSDLCRKLLYDMQGGKLDPHYTIQNFKDWRSAYDEKKKSADYLDAEYKSRTKTIFQIVKYYLKLIIRNLKENERHIYIQVLVKLMESKTEKEIIKKMTNENDVLFESFFNSIKDEGELSKFFSRMLYIIGAKLEQDKGYQKINESVYTEIDRNFNDMWSKFRTLYKIFQPHKVFTSFID